MFDPKKAGEEANRMIAELNQSRQAAPEQPPVEEQVADAGDAITTDIDTSAVTPAQPTPQPPSATPDPALAELKRQLDAADQRWKVLQGMIDKKDEELEQMRVLFAQMQSQPPAAPAPAPTASFPFTDEDREVNGETIDIAIRAATYVATKIVKEELAKLAPVLDQVEQNVTTVKKSSAQMAYDRFIDSLTAKVSDWESLNSDAGFLNWLNEVDELTGVARLALLRDAFSKYDATRVAKFFVAYKKETGLDSAPATTEAPAAPAAEQPSVADPKKFVAPGKSRAATTPKVDSGNAGKQWTRAEIAKLYDDKMKGKISPKDFESLERDLFKAQREGRIAA